MGLIENLESLLQRGQDNALLRFGLGGELLRQGRAAEAAVHLRKAVEHDATYSAAWKRLGQALTEAQDTRAAVEAYTQGIAVAEAKGDVQAAKEMRVFLKRLQKQRPGAQ